MKTVLNRLRNVAVLGLLAISIVCAPFGGTLLSTASAQEAELPAPTLSTDKADYQPGEIVTLLGQFFQSLQHVVVRIFGDAEVGDHHYDTTLDVVADTAGSFLLSNMLDNMYRPLYTVVASSLDGEVLATMTFTDAPSAAGNLDQCANGSLSSPAVCTGSAWQNGNLNANQAHYVEGDSAPYRMVLTNVPTSGINTVVIEYDVKHSGKHALDYLTSFDRTETTANPCSGVGTCVGPTLATIPTPSSAGSPVVGMPTALFAALPASEKQFSLYNGAYAGTGITYVSEGNLNVAQSATRVQIQFTATDPTVVFAWGGHIGTTLDWGIGNSAGGISGSPYHMRLIELNGKGGNQDRSLSSGAIIPIQVEQFGTLTIDKVTQPSGDTQSFGFTVSGPVAGVANLTDGAAPVVFSNLTSGTYTVIEDGVSGWTLAGADCTGVTVTPVARGVSFDLAPGVDAVCTFTNTKDAKLTVVKQVTNDNGGSLEADDFLLFVDATLVENASAVVTAVGTHIVSETQQPGYAQISIGGDCVADGSITLAPGDEKTCVITNDDIQPTLTVIKNVINDNGGTLDPEDFSLFVNASPITHNVATGMNAGNYVVSETQQPGYAQISIAGDCAADGSITLAPGDEKTCVITNDDEPGEIRGMKFEDVNGNGSKDVGEQGLAGWTINLTGTVDGSTVTDANGNYVFADLSAGTYSLTETQQAGYVQTTANPAPISLALGEIVEDVDFGNFKLVNFSGLKWHDLDGDGLQGSGEGALAGWTFYIDANNNNVMDIGELSGVPDVNGEYIISGVGPGTWSVCESALAGWTQTFPVGGACYTITTSSGVNVGDLRFGNINEHEGTIGFWRNWNRHNKFTQTQINGWLTTINTASSWLMSEAGYAANTNGMVGLINDATKYCSQYPDKIECSKRKFLAQYMVNRLNVESGKKALTSMYNLSGFNSTMTYLGISPTTSVTLGTYISKVEAKAATSPNRNQFLWMATVSDFINNSGI